VTDYQAEVKPFRTYAEQIDILRSRGLIVNNEEKAINILKRLNYYRFTAYTLTFKRDDIFFKGTTFETIYRHYEFDSRLRNLLVEIIEYVEVAFRSYISYELGSKYGPLGYMNSENFRNEVNHQEFLANLNTALLKSKDPFVLHHRTKYQGNFPIWVALEVVSFSTLSKLFRNILIPDQRSVAKNNFGIIHHEEISSWLYALTVVRNRCAHYSRLFNQDMKIKPRFRIEDKGLDIRSETLFAVVYNLKYLINDRMLWRNWVTKLEALISEYNEVNIKHLGFKEDWFSLLNKRVIMK
jgi:abortive infection bacteriophage resistance protein